MGDFVFTKGDTAESISIMKEAAQWLIDEGKPLWTMEELDALRMRSPDEFIVMYDGGRNSIATLILSFKTDSSGRIFPPALPVSYTRWRSEENMPGKGRRST